MQTPKSETRRVELGDLCMTQTHLVAMNLVAYFEHQSLRSQKQLLPEGTLFSAYLKIPIFFDGRLTPREIDCLTLTALGHSPVTIAKSLQISEDRVDKHCNSIQKKLGCSSTQQAIVQGIKYGEVQLCLPNKQVEN
jgi:DNA-binding CsgD family transcriptional regulator